MFISNGIVNKTMEHWVPFKNNQTDQYLLNSNNTHHMLLIKKEKFQSNKITILQVIYEIYLYHVCFCI